MYRWIKNIQGCHMCANIRGCNRPLITFLIARSSIGQHMYVRIENKAYIYENHKVASDCHLNIARKSRFVV